LTWITFDRTPIWFRHARSPDESSVKAAGGQEQFPAGLTTAFSVDHISSLLSRNCLLLVRSNRHPAQNTDMAAIVLLPVRAVVCRTIRAKKGLPKMQNPDLPRWLEMVWDALDEQDALKRDHLLNAADAFLQSDNQEPDSAPSLADSTKIAA
jgi:hypothetical protein